MNIFLSVRASAETLYRAWSTGLSGWSCTWRVRVRVRVVPRLVDGLVRMVLYLEGVKMEGVEMRCGRWEELWIWALGLGLRHLVWVWVLVL